MPVRATGRPLRDRVIVYVLLSMGLRREELIRLDLDQVSPNTPAPLRQARQGRVARVRGKGDTERIVLLSHDASVALADYLERELYWLPGSSAEHGARQARLMMTPDVVHDAWLRRRGTSEARGDRCYPGGA